MNQPENNNRIQDSSDYSEEWLSAYIDDELTNAQRAIVEQRLASDSETQQLLEDLQRVRGLVSRLPAWSGKLISATDFTQVSGVAMMSTDADADSDHVGDHHDELQPGPEATQHCDSKLHSESIDATLERDSDMAHDSSGPSAGAIRSSKSTLPEILAHPGRWRSPTWMQPLALAACLLLVLGGGAWLLNSGSPWTLATSNTGS
ncbi:MAG: hypothetical protein ABI557_08160, partial [Aureliella sp.]